MSTSKIDIWNMALHSAQTRSTISSEDEATEPANICRLWWEPTVHRVLKAAYWPCASRYSRLALLVERDHSEPWEEILPAPGFTFSYSAPADMLAPQYLHSFRPFDRVVMNGVNCIMTNDEQAILRYTFMQHSTQLWDAGLIDAVTNLLAFRICRPVTGKLGLSDRLMQAATDAILTARTEVANEIAVHTESVPEAIQMRGYASQPFPTSYAFPYGSINGTPA